jgi:uncharacterized protein (DUF58 family)
MIPPQVLQQLRYIEIDSARTVRSARVGPHRSRPRGPGFEFDQHVPYRSGDDVRRIDWNVTARLNAAYVRQTFAERELDLVLVLDTSTSMRLGASSGSKKEALTYISGSLLFSAARDQINAGFIAFSDQVLAWSPPRPATGRAWRTLEEIWGLEPASGATAMLPAIRHLQASLRSMAVVVLISDFLVEDALLSSPEFRILATSHDVVALVIEDAADTELPPGRGYVRVRDVESGRERVIALNGRTRSAYAESVETRRRAMKDSAYRLGIDVLTVSADQPVLQPVIDMFASRRSR